MEKMEKIQWGEVYSNPNLAKEIGQKVISIVNNKKVVYTHNGVFHSDEVFCTALLKYICGDFKVIRTRQLPEEGFVYDVGGGDFDHHQSDEYRLNDDGIFAAFGKLWCTVGRTIEGLREEAWEEIDRSFVSVIDLTDNTGVMNPVNYYINSLRVEGINDTVFEKAVEVAYNMLTSIIQAGLEKSKELDEFEAEVKSASKDSKILELSRFYQISRDVYSTLPYSWIIYPAGEEYTIQAVGKELMPEDKRGLGPNGDIIFTHKGGWIGKAKSREAALSLISL